MTLFGGGSSERQRSKRSFAIDSSAITEAPASAGVTSRAPISAAMQRTLMQKPRHAGIFDAIHRLDTQMDASARQNLIAWVQDQYVAEYGDIPIGFLAKCFLGPPYIDHRLDLVRSIVEHFTPSDTVPSPFDRARSLARHSAYEFVEVYSSGRLIAVRADGMTEILPEGK